MALLGLWSFPRPQKKPELCCWRTGERGPAGEVSRLRLLTCHTAWMAACPALLCACVGLSGVMERWRRAAALGFALIIGLFAFNIAIHSVHHLFQPHPGTECPLFWASQHATSTLADVDVLALDALPLAAEKAPSLVREAIPSDRFC
jgi:hypothetical protein